MPAQKGKSILLQRYGSQIERAHEAHKADEVEFSDFGDLPEGIENGIAQLTEAKFDITKNGDLKGEPFFFAQGVVVSPKTHNGIKVEGRFTKIMEMVCPTPNRASRKTVDDHIKWIYNELRKLGVNTNQIQGANGLEAMVESLKQARPFFTFRTWKGKATPQFPNPRVNHSWGGLADYDPEEADDGVTDETEVPPPPKKVSRNGAPQAQAQATPTAPPKRGRPVPQPEPEPEPAEEFDEFGDLDSLAAQADAGDQDVADKLKEMALGLGYSEEEVDNVVDWAAVVRMIQEKSEGGSGAGTEEAAEDEEQPEDSWAPKTGQVYNFRPVNQKTKKPATKPIEVEITAVSESDKTVSLKSLQDPKQTWQGIGWGLLES